MQESHKLTGRPVVAVVGDAAPVHGVISELSDDDRLQVSDSYDGGNVDCLLASSDELDTVRRILADDPDLPFVAFGNGSMRDEAVDVGALEYVRIPVDDERTFACRLRRYAEGHRAKRDGRRLDSVFQHSPNQIALHDEDGDIVEVNPRVTEALGYSRDEILGMNVSEIEVGVETDQLEELWEEYEYGEPIRVEGRHRRKDGTEFPVEVDIGKVLYDDEELFVAISRDITRRKKRERERERYESYVRSSSDLITHLDDDGTILYQSPSAERILGMEKDELVGQDVFDYVHPDDRESVAREFMSLVNDSEKITQDVEFRFRYADGSYVWLEAIGRDETDTELGGVVVSSRDVTERREREEKLERYRQIVESSRDALWMFSPDFSETIFINSPYEEIFGQPVEELYRDTTAFLDAIHPEDRDEILHAMEEAPDGEVEFEVRVNPDEGYGRWVWGRGHPVYDDGELIGVSGFTRDVTGIKEREKELERSRDLLRHTERIADTGGWEADVETGEQRWTEGMRKIHGFEGGTAPDVEEALEFYHPDDRERVKDAYERCRDACEPYDLELRIVVDGETRWIRAFGEAVCEDDCDESDTVKVRGAAQDITERKERERRLKEQKELLERRNEQIQFFNSLLRHDMLNSMNVIHGNAEMLAERLPEDSHDHESVRRILRQSDKIIDLTNRVRSVLKTVDEGADLTEMNLSEVIEERVENFRESYDADVTVNAPDGVRVIADDLLGDVLGNVLVNAVEHNDKDNPRVEVTVEEDDGTATVRVADNGPGVPDGLKENIFREGAKGDTSGGVGFGLYFVDAMVTEYGGNVRVEDNEPEGAVFVIELPLA